MWTGVRIPNRQVKIFLFLFFEFSSPNLWSKDVWKVKGSQYNFELCILVHYWVVVEIKSLWNKVVFSLTHFLGQGNLFGY